MVFMLGNFFLFLFQTTVVLFLILNFGGSTIQNSWATPLAAATCTIRELVLFKGSYILSLYGMYVVKGFNFVIL